MRSSGGSRACWNGGSRRSEVCQVLRGTSQWTMLPAAPVTNRLHYSPLVPGDVIKRAAWSFVAVNVVARLMRAWQQVGNRLFHGRLGALTRHVDKLYISQQSSGGDGATPGNASLPVAISAEYCC